MSAPHKYLLDESQLPKAWYNINADMPVPPQPLSEMQGDGQLARMSPRTIAILRQLEMLKTGDFVFPGQSRNKPLSAWLWKWCCGA